MVAASMAPKAANGVAASVEPKETEETVGPVVGVLKNRLRNLKKRLRNVEEIQAKLDAGKTLNADQVRAWARQALMTVAMGTALAPDSPRPPRMPPLLIASSPAPIAHKCAPLLQELSLSSKPGVLAAIDELEKMTAGLKEALKEELGVASSQAREEALAEAEAGEQAGPGGCCIAGRSGACPSAARGRLHPPQAASAHPAYSVAAICYSSPGVC